MRKTTLRQLHLKPVFWKLASAMQAIVLSTKSVLSAPSFKSMWMDEQREMVPPAATRPLEELPFPAKQPKMLNPNAPEWFAKPSHG